jgi:hypothetical protein
MLAFFSRQGYYSTLAEDDMTPLPLNIKELQ